MTPWLSLSMTPLLTGINAAGVDFCKPEPKKNAFFSDFGSELQQNRAFSGSKCFLEVAVKLKVLQFTFSELVGPDGALEDTGQ